MPIRQDIADREAARRDWKATEPDRIENNRPRFATLTTAESAKVHVQDDLRKHAIGQAWRRPGA
jgi:hypothetical protein